MSNKIAAERKTERPAEYQQAVRPKGYAEALRPGDKVSVGHIVNEADDAAWCGEGISL
jgi:hypothetical protein